MQRLLCYGSLKRNSYNFDRFGKDTQKYIKTLELEGYDLYDLGPYPGLTKGDGKVTVELHEVEDGAFSYIKRMEAGAGYSEGKEIVDGIEASIFFYEGNLEGNPKIDSGEWIG
jgi:gamma-glutamylcyclotransferase (GGCT)/AIG2-like uncharacterized protein YtfP